MRTHLFNSLLLLVVSFFYFIFSIRDQDIHLLSFDQVGKRSEINFNEGKVLLAGEEVVIETTSKYDNLGIILVRFYNDNRDSNDRLIFTVRKKDSTEIIHQSEHNTDQFLPNRLFGIGIPPQAYSKGTTYKFSLTSKNGSTESGIFVSGHEPIFLLRSVLSKQQVLDNPSLILQILKNKASLLLSNQDIRHSLFFSLIPLFFYLTWIFFYGSGFGFLFWIFLIGVYYLSKVPSDHIDYYLISLAFLWYQVIDTKKISFSQATIISIFISLSTRADNYFALSLLMLIVILLNSNTPRIKPISDFWREINDFSINDDSYKQIKILRLFILGFYALSISIVINSVLPYLSVYKVLITYPRDYFKEFIVLSLQLLLTLTLIPTFIFFQRKIKPQSMLFLSFVFLVFVFRFSSLVFYNALTEHLSHVYLISISPQSTHEAWVDVTITGKNFQDEPFRGQVLLGPDKTPQRIISWTNERILFRTNPELTKSGDICIITHSKGGSNCLPFSYQFKQ